MKILLIPEPDDTVKKCSETLVGKGNNLTSWSLWNDNLTRLAIWWWWNILAKQEWCMLA